MERECGSICVMLAILLSNWMTFGVRICVIQKECVSISKLKGDRHTDICVRSTRDTQWVTNTWYSMSHEHVILNESRTRNTQGVTNTWYLMSHIQLNDIRRYQAAASRQAYGYMTHVEYLVCIHTKCLSESSGCRTRPLETSGYQPKLIQMGGTQNAL